jgi:hypothetical protein
MLNRRDLFLSYLFILLGLFAPLTGAMFGFSNKNAWIAHVPLLNILYYAGSLIMFVSIILGIVFSLAAHLDNKKQKVNILEKALHGIFIVVLILEMCIYPLVGFASVYSAINNEADTGVSPSPLITNGSAEFQVLTELVQKISDNSSILDKFSPPSEGKTVEFKWQMPDGINVRDDEEWSIEADVTRSGDWTKYHESKVPYAGVDEYDLPSASNPEVVKLISQIKEFFLSKSFTQDKWNSSEITYLGKSSDSELGYKTQNMWCHILVVDLDRTNSVSKFKKDASQVIVKCSTKIGSIYSEQKPFYPIIAKSVKTPFSIEKNVGNYVSLNTSGLFVIGQIKDGQFISYYKGQNDPPCAIVEKYSIPGDVIKAVAGNVLCFNDEIGHVKNLP